MRRLNIALLFASSAPWAAGQFVTGIKAGVNEQTGQRPARLNINDMHRAGGPTWDLFILSLDAVFNTPENDLLSWFQIAGIHGLPFKPYNGVEQVPGGLEKSGYCPHGQLTFITWHRPYVALAEQTIHVQAQKIAARYPSSSVAAYKSAAETLRFPYWDWAIDSQLPPIITQPTITITTPTGPQTIRNPLYSYRFQSHPFTDPDFLSSPLAQFNETKRCTNFGNEKEVDYINQYDFIANQLANQQINLKKGVYAVFSKTKSFVEMASEDGRGVHFEGPHNLVHQYSGGHPMLKNKGGHIQPAEWSAFDPLFWLHHTNVDRLFALWQAINPTSSMFTGSVDGQAVFGTPDGPVTPDSPLKPFQKDASTFWTNKMTETTRVFGYTYPELNDWELSKEELAKRVTAEVNRLYAPATTTTRRGLRRAATNGLAAGRDWAVTIDVDRAELPVPCSVEVRIGEKVAGEYTLLSMPKTGTGHGYVSLEGLVGDVGNKTAEEVVGDLKGRMKVVVRAGERLAPLPKSLKVEIEERDFVPPKSVDEFPKFGEKKTWKVEV